MYTCNGASENNTPLYRNSHLNDWSDHPNYNCRLTFEDGSQRLVYANWLHNERLDTWLGWTCMAGSRRLYIDKNLQVWSGECRNDHLGSALDGFVTLEHAICKQEVCSGCTDDLAVAKHR